MTHCTKGFMAKKLRDYQQSDLYSLSHCYLRASASKEQAFEHCRYLMDRYSGYGLRILSFNTFAFSVGFIGRFNGQRAFFYITKDNDRYIYIN